MQKYIYFYWEPWKVSFAMVGTTVTNQQASNHLQRGHYKKHTNIEICWRGCLQKIIKRSNHETQITWKQTTWFSNDLCRKADLFNSKRLQGTWHMKDIVNTVVPIATAKELIKRCTLLEKDHNGPDGSRISKIFRQMGFVKCRWPQQKSLILAMFGKI